VSGFWRRCRELLQRRRVDRESVVELEQHLALAAADKVRAGVEEHEARRQARLELGSVEAVRERLAEGRSGFMLEQLAKDIVYAWRVLRRAPGQTLLSVATIGVGIAVSTVLFALIDGVVLRPLPYPGADRLVGIADTNLALGVDRTGAASGNIDDWRRESSSFDGIAGYYTMGRTLSADTDADVILTAQVSADFFPLSHVEPILGRTFTQAEIRAAQFNTAAAPIGADPVVMLGHELWQQRFGGDPGIIDRAVNFERRTFRVVGVMPPGFALPAAGVQAWIPWDLSGDRPRDQHYLGAIGRLRPDVSVAQADQELKQVAANLGREYPETNEGWSVRVSPLAEEVVGDSARVLWILFAAVGLVLLVACANVALLSVMRGLDRSVETAVRLALGSTAGRLLRQSWTESLMLALIGGAVGVGLAAGGMRLIPRLVSDFPRLEEVALSARVLWFAFGVTTLAAVLSGLLPAWRGARTEPTSGLRTGSVRTTAAARQHRVRDGLVVAQVALALVLLCGSGLLVRSFLALRAADPGFDSAGVRRRRCLSRHAGRLRCALRQSPRASPGDRGTYGAGSGPVAARRVGGPWRSAPAGGGCPFGSACHLAAVGTARELSLRRPADRPDHGGRGGRRTVRGWQPGHVSSVVAGDESRPGGGPAPRVIPRSSWNGGRDECTRSPAFRNGRCGFPGGHDHCPHRIPLLRHAVAGEADDVADFLRSTGAASV